MAVSRAFASAGAAALGVMLAGCGGDDATTQAPPPPEKVATRTVDIGGDLVFTCLHTPQTCDGSNENVLMVHGWPERKEFYQKLMMDLADASYCGLACDMHGYSPGASPASKTSYDSDRLRDDTFKIARKADFSTFHLIGHDHGATLGWRMAATPLPDDLKMVHSYVGMSVPHNDVLSKALFGAEANMDQQVASQYFALFVRPDSAKLGMGPGTTVFNDGTRCRNYFGEPTCFENIEGFQKTLYWYNGVFEPEDSAKSSMPPDFDLDTINASTSPGRGWAMGIRGENPDMNGMGFAQVVPTGNITVPTLYICGSDDTALLCGADWALKTEDYCQAGYTYLEVVCGHGLTTCDQAAETKKVHDGILAHLEKHPYKRRAAQFQEFV